MALYNLHIACDLADGFVLSVFPESSGSGFGFDKLRYKNADLLCAALRNLGVEEERLDKLINCQQDGLPITLAGLPLTKAALAKIRPEN